MVTKLWPADPPGLPNDAPVKCRRAGFHPTRYVEGTNMDVTNDPTEQVKHRRYIEILADEMQRSVEDVEPVFDDVMADLKATAQVGDFVPIFAWRRARQLLLRG